MSRINLYRVTRWIGFALCLFVTDASAQPTPPNSPPTAADQSVTTNENEAKTIILSGSDVEDDPLTYTIGVGTGPSNGAISDFDPAAGTLTYTPNTDYSGNDSFTYTVNDGTVDSAPATVSITVIPLNGLSGEYYNNSDLTDLVLERFDMNIDFSSWAAGSPDGAIDPDTFSVRWTGKLMVDNNETYTFSAVTDDGVRLWIDGYLVIDYWQTGGVSIDGAIDLISGLHDIKLEFFEDTGDAFVSLSWSSASTPQAIIPTDHLFPPDSDGAAPVLDWTGEANYTTDGIDPEIGDSAQTFTYRIAFSDTDGDVPMTGYPRVHILNAGDPISGSPFAMSFESGDPSGGSIYSYNTTLPDGTDYSYYFDALDATGRQALSGPTAPTPTAPINAPLVGDGIISAPPSIPELISPVDGQTGLATTVTFVWMPSTDPEGDTLTYSVTVCEDSSFEGCESEVVAQAKPLGMGNISLAGTGIGFLMAGILLVSGIRNRRTVWMVMGLFLLTGMLQVSCSSGGGDGGGGDGGGGFPADSISYQVSGLNPATPYHWKVSVDDGQGNIIQSIPRTFTTQ